MKRNLDSKEIVDEFVADLRADLQGNGIQIPTLPDVSIQALFTINRDDSSIDDVTSVVARDTAMAARLIRYANSPLYRGLTRCATIKSSITRLGLEKTKNVLLSLAMRDVFSTGHRGIRQRMETLWEHSVEVAVVSTLLARRYRHLDQEEALLAGLIHDVGVIPILNKAKNVDVIVENEKHLSLIIASLHMAVGKAVLKAWNFEQELIDVAAEHDNLGRDPGDDKPIDYVDIVQAANIESYQSTRHRLASVDRMKVASLRRLGATPEDPTLPWDDDPTAMQQISRIFV
ncbi:HDOD domain-containing protein [Ectothiorhodospira variabilis]|uniref:HDOD domain-containing protein n=1 Tax=Ectothiorhodospira variabilis TaxID=505694 RepID=UPI001EFAD230|nr:HDOD domain-containing protein [Ectothiorhodospira variabilis]MCG5502444.1 HDOD domain-containing protein [Ectothiorhodospira variabilis]MCG5505790.1 HDOD domain-containing protein [Ectothiorhodospira variabilis]